MADGAIDVTRADAEWLPSWRPLANANPYAPSPDPQASAQTDAVERRGLIDTGMPEEEAMALLGELEQMLQAQAQLPQFREKPVSSPPYDDGCGRGDRRDARVRGAWDDPERRSRLTAM
jgi:hypothetical protein